MAVVAITGISSGPLGRQLLQQLELDADVERVVGVDVAPPEGAGEFRKLAFHACDPADDYQALFLAEGVTAAIHMAFALRRDRAREEAWNLGAARRFLAACGAADVQTVCLLSGTLSYGARLDNPPVLYEGAPLRPPEGFGLAKDQAAVEELFYYYVKDHPESYLQIVRACPIVGASSRDPLATLWERRVLLLPYGSDALIQFVHEDDAVRALQRLIKTGNVGVFNLAADGALTLPQMARLSERRVLRVPYLILYALTWLGWRLGWRWLAPLPPAALDYLRYPWAVAGVKLKSEALFNFRYDGPQAFLEYLEARSELGGAGYEIYQDVEDLDEDELDELDELDEDDELEPGEAEEERPAPLPPGGAAGAGEPPGPAAAGSGEAGGGGGEEAPSGGSGSGALLVEPEGSSQSGG